MNDNFMFELIKECALHPDRPIETTKQVIKLTEQELEEVFDKVNMSEENRTIYRNTYFKKSKEIKK